VNGDICTICCGTGREQSIDCPLECPYLRDAHEHERAPELDPESLPNRDIEVTEDFLHSNEILMAYIAVSLMDAAMENRAATDWDLREALDALTKTYRTLQSGIYYESLPTNVFAAGIAAHVQSKLADIKKREAEATGATTIRDATILGILVFLQRLEYSHNNGRKRSRAFLDFLRAFYNPLQEPAGSEIAEPDEPRIIL
jgi:hypothetical protein